MKAEEITDEIYFGELQVMFNTKGWKILMLELTENAHTLNDLQRVKSTEELYFRQGELAQLGRLLNFEDTLERAQEEESENPNEGT